MKDLDKGPTVIIYTREQIEHASVQLAQWIAGKIVVWDTDFSHCYVYLTKVED